MDFLYMDARGCFQVRGEDDSRSDPGDAGQGGLDGSGGGLVLLHQANARINQSIAKKLHISIDRVPMNVDRCGNTSAASVPILLDEVNRKGMLKPGRRL